MLKKLETELKLRGFSEVTVKNYMRHNQLFLNYTKKEPPSTSLILSALKFFYKEILEKDIFSRIKTPKLEKKIPTVLSKEEMSALLNAIENNKHRILVELLYSS